MIRPTETDATKRVADRFAKFESEGVKIKVRAIEGGILTQGFLLKNDPETLSDFAMELALSEPGYWIVEVVE